MNRSEIAKLLALCASYDQRTVGPSDVEAWTLAISDLNAGDCAHAIAYYYRHTADPRANRIGVGQIYAGVKRIRADRIERAPITQPPAGLDPDDEMAYRRWLAADRRGAAGRLGVVPAIEAKS